MHPTTLCYLLKDDLVLLGLKKRDFGEGLWNGYGGKVREDESPEAACIRELREESGVIVQPADLVKVAVNEFFFTNAPKGKDWDELCHVYTAKRWRGVPTETEEMLPAWFYQTGLPFGRMWQTDRYFLPLIFDGQKVRGAFTFGADNTSILKHEVHVVEEL